MMIFDMFSHLWVFFSLCDRAMIWYDEASLLLPQNVAQISAIIINIYTAQKYKLLAGVEVPIVLAAFVF